MATSSDPRCPKCSGAPVAIETATAQLREPLVVDLVVRCSCGVTCWRTRSSLGDVERERERLRELEGR